MKSLVMGLPLIPQFRTKRQLAIDICADAYADGLRPMGLTLTYHPNEKRVAAEARPDSDVTTSS